MVFLLFFVLGPCTSPPPPTPNHQLSGSRKTKREGRGHCRCLTDMRGARKDPKKTTVKILSLYIFTTSYTISYLRLHLYPN